MINLIMPMGGAGSRFSENNIVLPKPLISISGKPFFYWATESIRKYCALKSLSFVVLQKHIDENSIDKAITSLYPEARLVILPEILNGAVLTCLEGVKLIDNDLPVVFNDCDHMFYAPSFYQACNSYDSEVDGLLLTFESQEPKYSFLEFNEDGYVKRTVEKQVISHDAICGAYLFKNKRIFINSAQEYLNLCSYNEFYISGVYNIMSNEGKRIAAKRVIWHLPFGTPEEYFAAKQSPYFEGL